MPIFINKQIHKVQFNFNQLLINNYVQHHSNKLRNDMNISLLKIKIDRILIYEIDWKAERFINKIDYANKDFIFIFK